MRSHSSVLLEMGRRGALAVLPDSLKLPARWVGTRVAGYLEPELARLDELAAPGLAVDVGANHGLYSYALVRNGHQVIAFEPQPWCADTLRRWARGRVLIYEIGLSDESGVLELHIPHQRGRRYTGHASFEASAVPGEGHLVPVQPLDAFKLSNVSFIKIDVEGHERQVLDGARDTLERCRPVLLVEINAEPLSDQEMLQRFNTICDLGYRGEFLHDGAWRPIESYDVVRYQRDRLSGDAAAPYVFNFVFRPR